MGFGLRVEGFRVSAYRVRCIITAMMIPRRSGDLVSR